MHNFQLPTQWTLEEVSTRLNKEMKNNCTTRGILQQLVIQEKDDDFRNFFYYHKLGAVVRRDTELLDTTLRFARIYTEDAEIYFVSEPISRFVNELLIGGAATPMAIFNSCGARFETRSPIPLEDLRISADSLEDITHRLKNAIVENNLIKRTGEVRPLSRQRAQEETIILALKERGYDPRRLPKPQAGKAGVKQEIRSAMKYSAAVFDKAWCRLLDIGESAYEK